MTDLLKQITILLNNFGETFWNFGTVMFVQISVLVMILMVVDLLLRNKIRSVFRYWLWTLVLLKLVLPVSLTSPTSVAYWLNDYFPSVSMIADSASAINSVTNDTLNTSPTNNTTSIQGDLNASDPMLAQGASNSLDLKPDEISAANGTNTPAIKNFNVETERAITVPGVQLQSSAKLLLAWLTIVVMLYGMVLWRSVRVWKLTSKATDAPADLLKLMNDCCNLLGLKQDSVQLKVSDQVGSPAICGLRKPIILLPKHLLDKLDTEQFRLVFVHELSHWKRYDLHVNCLQTVLQVLYFYNPMIWFANIILRRLREQAVDETVLTTFKGQSKQYSSTLLDIVALKRFPADVSLQLIGIIEPRSPLFHRIHRIVTRPIPRSAKLGTVGILMIVLAGVVLLPMSGTERSHAIENSEKTEVKKEKPAVDKPASEKAILSGRIVDKSGSPVTDATLQLLPDRGGRMNPTKTDKDGYYQFSKIDKPGLHRIQIKSQRWVGIERRSKCPIVTLTANSNVVKNVTLERACQLRIETLNEKGEPVPGVTVYAKSLADSSFFSPETVRTNKKGHVTLGLKPSKFKYLVATSSPNYAIAKFIVKLNDPNKVTSKLILQRKGIDVVGKAICSDGKPPSGWRISALPDWWNFGRYPSGTKIGPDGSFTLSHIVSEKYNLNIAIPSGGGMSTDKMVIKSTDLSKVTQPLAVKLDHPSASGMVSLSGRIRIVGSGQHKGVRVYAVSNNPPGHGNFYIAPGKTEFNINPIVPGKYKLTFQSPGIERRIIKNVVAPSKDLDIKIVVTGKPKLRGTVVRDDNGQPIDKFRVRAFKIRSFSGPNYFGDSRWHEINNAKGEFELDVIGPGVYIIQVVAKELAWSNSEHINTDKQGDKKIQIKLSKGVSLSGTVVDEKGQPISDAKVIPVSKNTSITRGIGVSVEATEEGAAQTVNGKFTLKHVSVGKDILRIVHPDYTTEEVEIDIPDTKSKPDDLKVTLKQGGIVRGFVVDSKGLPEPNVTLYFQKRSSGDDALSRITTVVTDEADYYIASNLPEQICYVVRANERKFNGVVRQSILPENGKTSTLNFGDQTKLTGRLTVNGVPLANTRLVLSGDNPNFGIFRAYADTDENGSFVFTGAGPGERTLYYYYAPSKRQTDWIRVKSLQLTSEEKDLGTIDQAVGQLTVECVSSLKGTHKKLQVMLQTYRPIWTFGLKTGILAPRSGDNDPFVFNEVPPGKYELVVSSRGYPSVRQLVNVTREKINNTVTVELPNGKATLQGKMSKEKHGSYSYYGSLKLWSQDRRLHSIIVPDAEGNYKAENLPEGDYILVKHDVRNPTAFVDVSMKEGEVKTLDVTPGLIKKTKNQGFRVFQIYTSNGIALPGCEIKLEGPGGLLSPHSNQNNRQGFVGKEGTYDLTVAYPGFKTIHRKVELKLPGTDGRYSDDITINLKLQPIAE